MSQRLKLIIAYDGAALAGRQSQLHGNTVQDQLEKALKRITGQAIRVHGAGRTDTGVHALGQCAHIDFAGEKLTPPQLLTALNAVLIPAIRVLRCQRAPGEFFAFRPKGNISLPDLECSGAAFEYGRAYTLCNRSISRR
jgi:tRNA pseudouridine38-40 synthase